MDEVYQNFTLLVLNSKKEQQVTVFKTNGMYFLFQTILKKKKNTKRTNFHLSIIKRPLERNCNRLDWLCFFHSLSKMQTVFSLVQLTKFSKLVIHTHFEKG